MAKNVSNPDKMTSLSRSIIALASLLWILVANAQPQEQLTRYAADLFDLEGSDVAVEEEAQPPFIPRTYPVISPAELRPAVFDHYDIADTLSIAWPEPFSPGFDSDAFQWLDDANFANIMTRQLRQRYMVANPASVRYNERLLPEPPRQFHAVVDPLTAKLTFVDDSIYALPVDKPKLEMSIERRHWLHAFTGRIQFSQAYLSPNWYQGGSQNLTVLVNAAYDVKLNQTFHPKLMAEAHVSYNLAINSTPEDSLRNFNISQDLFQFNGKVGYKAFNKWWYSLTGSFKTQFFKNYEVNSPTLRAAFLSPAELNLGVGMTYSTANEKKTFAFDASISPFSWNMKTCINPAMNVADYNIEPGHKVAHEFGSSGEAKMTWKLRSNISWVSRLFVFTDYSYLQGDWENTFSFDINRFLSTQLYLHLRYDSSTPRLDDSRWHTWQLKEILSFGFSYKFATI